MHEGISKSRKGNHDEATASLNLHGRAAFERSTQHRKASRVQTIGANQKMLAPNTHTELREPMMESIEGGWTSMYSCTLQ